MDGLAKMDGCRSESLQNDANACNTEARPEETEQNDRVDVVWQQMSKGVSAKSLNSMLEKHNISRNKSAGMNSSQISSAGWQSYLGLGSKKAPSRQGFLAKQPSTIQNGTSEDAKKLAAAALSAVRDAAAALAGAGRGKVEQISERRDFAGEEIEVKKLVDAESRDAAEKGKGASGSVSAVDAVLEQIKKKPKLSVLDKSKKDWSEFKDDNKGMEDELGAYKKSSNQYLDKVSFLQRTDYREFERERDVRLASQAKRKADMRED